MLICQGPQIPCTVSFPYVDQKPTVSRGRGVRPFSNTCAPIIIMRFVCLFETGSDAAQHGLELLLVATSTSYLLGLHMCNLPCWVYVVLGTGSQAISMLGQHSTY